MNMTIHCPGCRVSLHVPQSAAGRPARCPKCRRKFVIPSPDEVLEETVSQWIFEDLEHEDASRTRAAGDTLMGVVAEQQSRLQTADRETNAATATPPRPRPDTPTVAKDERDAAEKQSAPTTPRPAQPAPAPMPTPQPRQDRAPAPTLTRTRDASTAQPTDAQPRLIVRDCAQNGVVLAFEPRWLEHEGFCASMPVRCAFSGVDARAELIARPMVFIDRYRGADRAPHLVETHYERHLTGDQPSRELVRAVGQLENMIPPFNHPLLYYVSKHHASQSLAGQIITVGDHQTLCEVTIPDGRVALAWLGNVNGICGDEYEQLRSDVAMLGSDAWRALSEKCRERLAVWCRFQVREQFRLYINDADFGSHDAGLAGVVITDHRLIYHKYHHGGSIDLANEATLHVKTDGTVARLTYDSNGQLARIGKIHIKDMSKLIEALATSPSLRIELGAAAAKA